MLRNFTNDGTEFNKLTQAINIYTHNLKKTKQKQCQNFKKININNFNDIC